MIKTFKVVSVNTSKKKGTVKHPVASIRLQRDYGIVGDAHAGPGLRQVSLLADEDVAIMKSKGADVTFGTFAENITTEGVDLAALPVGTRLEFGESVLEISQIGKQCHSGCAILKQTGDCIMPKRGVFAVVIKEGVIRAGDPGTYRL